MTALTVWQPYAWALFHGKPVENRDWPPPAWLLRRELAIHAGKTYDAAAEEFLCEELGLAALPQEARACGVIGTVTLDRYVRGGVIGAGEGWPKGDPILRSPFYFGSFGWVFGKHVELATPVPCRGLQRLWQVPSDVEDQVRAQLRAGARGEVRA